MADNDDLIPDRALGATMFPLASDWDVFKESVNNSRRSRLLACYTDGTITYNGTGTVTWSQNIVIVFLSATSDTVYTNTISAGNISSSGDNHIVYCRLVDSNTTIPMVSVAKANFNRASASPGLNGQSGDVYIIGFTTTDSTDFFRVGLTVNSHVNLLNKNSETNVKHLTDAQVSALHAIYVLTQANVNALAITEVGTLSAGNVSARDTIGLLASKADGDIFYYDSTFKRLAKGSDTEVLTLVSGLPAWVAPSGGGFDIVKYYARILPIGSWSYTSSGAGYTDGGLVHTSGMAADKGDVRSASHGGIGSAGNYAEFNMTLTIRETANYYLEFYTGQSGGLDNFVQTRTYLNTTLKDTLIHYGTTDTTWRRKFRVIADLGTLNASTSYTLRIRLYLRLGVSNHSFSHTIETPRLLGAKNN